MIVPWNQVLEALPDDDGRRRVLLGIPGNHDWYDGLDGFARMFRRRAPGGDCRARASRCLAADAAAVRGMGARVRARRHRRQARGARAVGLHAGAEREPLRPAARARHRPAGGRSPAHRRSIHASSEFLREPTRRIPTRPRWSCCPIRSITSAIRAGPARRWSRTCTSIWPSRETFVLTGDIHHYERLERGKLLHVIAGGGGAFLHPARIAAGA